MHVTNTNLFFLLLSPLATALSIISPAPSAFINPGTPLTITWASSSLSNDPANIDVTIIHPSVDNSVPATTVLGTNIPTVQGTLTVASWTVLDWGKGYTIQVTGAGNAGNVLATVPDLTLGGATGEALTDASGSITGYATSASSGGVPTASLTGAGNPTETNTGTGMATATAVTTSASGTGTGTARSSSSVSRTTGAASSSSSGAVASPSGSSAAAAGLFAAPSQLVASGWLGLLIAAVLA